MPNILPNVWVGPPVESAGVAAVLNLQSDADVGYLGSGWSVLQHEIASGDGEVPTTGELRLAPRIGSPVEPGSNG